MRVIIFALIVAILSGCATIKTERDRDSWWGYPEAVDYDSMIRG